jgi:ABC-2 type transport system permease protein
MEPARHPERHGNSVDGGFNQEIQGAYMNLVRTMVWKEMKQLKADPIMSRLIVIPVLVQMFVLGYAITTEVKNTTLTVVDKCNSTLSRSLVRDIVHNPLFRFVGRSSSEGLAREMLDAGAARIALVIPQDFSLALDRESETPVGVLVDGQDANSSTVAAGYVSSIIMDWSRKHLQGKLGARGLRIENFLPVRVSPVILYNPMLKSTWYMVPALAVVLVTMVTALLTGFSIVKEKEAGTLEQLMVTPLKPLHVILGKIAPLVVIGLIELCAVLLIATLWFGVPFQGNFFTLMLFGLVYMASSLGIGILTSTVARTPQQVLFLTFFVMLFFLLLSGFFIPIENMPGWVQTVTYVNPLRYFMFVIREIFLKGSGLAELWQQGLAMLGIGALMFAAALLTFQRKVS